MQSIYTYIYYYYYYYYYYVNTSTSCPDLDVYSSLHGAQSFLMKLTGSQLVKKFPAFYGTWKFITAFKRARQISLSNKTKYHSGFRTFVNGSKRDTCLPWGVVNTFAQNPKMEDHPLSAVRNCLFNILAATLHSGGRSCTRTWGHAMPWWQGPTYHGVYRETVILV